MIVYTYNKEIVSLEDEPFSAGGEGEVRRVTSRPSWLGNVCAKLYYIPKQTREQEKKIRFMVENPPSNIGGNGMMLAWPLETIYNQSGTFIGFLMPMAFPDSKKLTILILPKIKKTLKAEWYKFDKEYNIKYALVSRMKLINNIAIPIHILHATNKYVLKDFKPDNVLVTSTGKVTIVDMDSIQICENGRLLFPGTAATDTYIPPEFYKGVGQNKKDILEKSWDNFAVSVVFYQLLFGLHPYVVVPYVDSEESNTIPYCIKENLFPFGINASKIKSFAKPHNNFNIVPPQVQQLFVRAFGLNPNDRPQAMEWGKTIKQVLDSVVIVEPGPVVPPPPPPVPEYNIIAVPSYNGYITFSANTEKAGKIISIYDNPENGYELGELSYSTASSIVRLGRKRTFVMPNSDVKVCATFVKKKSRSKGWIAWIVIGAIAWWVAFLLLVSMFF